MSKSGVEVDGIHTYALPAFFLLESSNLADSLSHVANGRLTPANLKIGMSGTSCADRSPRISAARSRVARLRCAALAWRLQPALNLYCLGHGSPTVILVEGESRAIKKARSGIAIA